jgi:translation initiation factor 5
MVVIYFGITDPTKYFGCELGAQTQIDLKNERYIVN